MLSLYFKTAKEWKTWLQDNHDKEIEVWLIFFKKDTGKPSIDYESAVEIFEPSAWFLNPRGIKSLLLHKFDFQQTKGLKRERRDGFRYAIKGSRKGYDASPSCFCTNSKTVFAFCRASSACD